MLKKNMFPEGKVILDLLLGSNFLLHNLRENFSRYNIYQLDIISMNLPFK